MPQRSCADELFNFAQPCLIQIQNTLHEKIMMLTLGIPSPIQGTNRNLNMLDSESIDVKYDFTEARESLKTT